MCCAVDAEGPFPFEEFPLNDRTQSRHVPPEPGDPTRPNPSTVDNSEQRKKESPEFREALKKDDAREAQSDFSIDKDLWGRSGAGPDVGKIDPEDSLKGPPPPARHEEGYGE
jgi:hypothetical protein